MDESASLPVSVDPKPGPWFSTVVPPGGKRCLSEMMQDTGRILAMDIHKHKVDLMEETFRKAGRKNIECTVHDARVLIEDLKESADGVLLDVPCTGLGIIRRKPDIKWNYEDEPELLRLQKDILDTCCMYVKPGGALVYSTCTVLPEENEDRIKEFLKEHPNFELEKFVTNRKDNKICYRSFVNTYPHVHGTDGFCREIDKAGKYIIRRRKP